MVSTPVSIRIRRVEIDFEAPGSLDKDDEAREEIRTLDKACFLPTEAYLVDLSGSPACWVAELSTGEVVGYAVAHELEGVAYFDRYGVLPDYRGARLGRRLLRASIAWARKAGLPYMWTYTVPSNASSNNCLIAAGFKSWSRPNSESRYCFWKKDLSR